MKQKSTKILILLIAIILIAGTIITFTKGLNFELKYKDNQNIELNLGQEFKEDDMLQIAEEVFGKQQVIVQYIEVYKDAAKITTTQINDEQKADFIAKVNEKYGTELSSENIEIEKVAHIRGRDIIKPYITPFIISTIIILIFIIIRYYKLNVLKVLLETIGIVGLAQLVLLGIMAITRMPIGKFTIPAIIAVYMFSLFVCTTKFEQDLEKINIKKDK